MSSLEDFEQRLNEVFKSLVHAEKNEYWMDINFGKLCTVYNCDLNPSGNWKKCNIGKWVRWKRNIGWDSTKIERWGERFVIERLSCVSAISACREKRVGQRSAESREFSPGAPVSSHMESWQGGLG